MPEKALLLLYLVPRFLASSTRRVRRQYRWTTRARLVHGCRHVDQRTRARGPGRPRSRAALGAVPETPVGAGDDDPGELGALGPMHGLDQRLRGAGCSRHSSTETPRSPRPVTTRPRWKRPGQDRDRLGCRRFLSPTAKASSDGVQLVCQGISRLNRRGRAGAGRPVAGGLRVLPRGRRSRRRRGSSWRSAGSARWCGS